MRNGISIGSVFVLKSREDELGKGSLAIKEPMVWLSPAQKRRVCGDGKNSTLKYRYLQYALNCCRPTKVCDTPEYKQYPLNAIVSVLLLLKCMLSWFKSCCRSCYIECKIILFCWWRFRYMVCFIELLYIELFGFWDFCIWLLFWVLFSRKLCTSRIT